tara:strand:- start:625 stop:1554 length:930 start_codon:yes stop_codon:yes gene_type:complete
MAETLNLDDVFSDLLAEQSGKPTKSDDEVLRQGLNRSGGSRNRGGGVSLGARERLNEQASSMIIDGVDYGQGSRLRRNEPLGDQPSGRYDFDKQPDVVPVETQTQRMPAKNRKAQLLTDQDIRTLAENRDYPVDFMGKDYFVNPSQPTESALAYSEIETPFEREEFLRNRRDYILEQRKEKARIDDMIQNPLTAYGAGAALGVAGGVVAASSAGIGAFAAAMSQLPIFPSAVPLAKMAGAGYLVRKLYDDITSDPGITEEEATKKIQEEVQKQLEKQQDTGSPPIVEKQPDATKEQQVEAYDQGKPVNL